MEATLSPVLIVVAGALALLWVAFIVWSWRAVRARTVMVGDTLRWRRGVLGFGMSLAAALLLWSWGRDAGFSPAEMMRPRALGRLAFTAVFLFPLALWGGYRFARRVIRPGGTLPAEGETPAR